jgi:hypothetical protein
MNENTKEIVFPSFLESLHQSFEMYKKMFFLILGTALFPYIFFVAIVLIYLIAGLAMVESNIFRWILVITGFIILTSVKPLSQIACLSLFSQKKEKNVWERYKTSITRLLPYVGMQIISILIIAIGYICFIIPGIIATTFLVFSGYIFVLENKKALDSIQQSYRYVKTCFWEIIWKLFLLFLLNITMLVLFAHIIPFDVGGIIYILIAYPFIMIYIFNLYELIKK